jgi:heptosyltransferase-2
MHKRSTAEIRRLIAGTPGMGAQPATNPELPSANRHQIHEYLHLVAALGADPTPLPPFVVATPFAATSLARHWPAGSQRPGCVIGLNPGAEYGPAKRWPVESFAAVANKLYRRLDCEFLIFGGPGDVALAERLRSLLPVPLAHGHVTTLAGKTRLGELLSALQACRVLLTNDTGPMHAAAALGIPVVVPFGSTSPELTGPGLPGDPRHQLIKSDAPCAPCFLRQCPIDFRCLKGIGVDRITAAVLQVVGAS